MTFMLNNKIDGIYFLVRGVNMDDCDSFHVLE